MALCSACQAIDIPSLPPFTGFNQLTSIGQAHHKFQDLRESSLSCPLCSLMFKNFMKDTTKHQLGAYGRDGNRKPHPIPKDQDTVLLLGLNRSGWNETEKRLHGFQALCGLLRNNYGLFVDEDTVAAVSNTVVGRLPRPIEQCDRPLKWLHTCLNTHTKCASYEKIVKDELSFPTRVLDVGDGSGSEVLRLVAGAGLVGRYVALSHCWGKSPVIKTTKASLNSFLQIIDSDFLTRTFRDAVMITRRLGVRYIWIDSLCIVQDDNEEWEREAANMAQVYSQSLVTLAASAASDGSQGLLRADSEFALINIAYPTGGPSALHNVVVRHPFHRFQSLAKEPLSTRGWTLQERVLSPRTLHYGSDQLHWECRESIESEAGGPPYYARFNQSEDESYYDGWLNKVSSDLIPQARGHGEIAGPEDKNEDDIGHQDGWYGLVEAYTERDLSYGDDKLPALSGLASVYGYRHKGTYVAGLWSQDLVFGLLWYAKPNWPLQRPVKYRAPSWSWASVDGPVSFFTLNCGRIPEWLIEIEDIIYWTSLAGPDPFGKVMDGALTVTGYLKEGDIKTVKMEVLGDVQLDGVLLGDGDAVQMLFDNVSAIGSVTLDSITPDGQTFCLLIACSYLHGAVEVETIIVLLLSPTEKKNEYRRIGFSALFPAREFRPESTLRPDSTISSHPGQSKRQQDSLVGWFDDAKKLTITIV